MLRELARRLPPDSAESGAEVVDRLYSLRVAGPGRRGVENFHLLYGDSARLARTTRLEEALDAFESDLQLYVAEAGRRRVFVHAGVVGWGGRAVVIPGRSFTGKTTLVAELVRAGATYYSDEYAVLDARGRVHPYARPLGVREGGTGRQAKVSVEALAGTSGTRPLPVGLVVVSEYRPGGRWRPRRLSSGQGVLALLAHTVSARRQPAAALEALGEVTARARVVRGARGEAGETAASILEMLNRSTRDWHARN